MREKNIQTMLSKVHNIHGVFELKLCKARSIRFDAVKEHQLEALIKVNENGLYHKISDSTWGTTPKHRFTFKKPFDFFYLKGVPAYVIICFCTPRQRKTCYYISIRSWANKMAESNKKSITEKEIKEISSCIIEL